MRFSVKIRHRQAQPGEAGQLKRVAVTDALDGGGGGGEQNVLEENMQVTAERIRWLGLFVENW